MRVTRKSLFEGETLQIGLFEARPTSDACGDVEWQKSNVVVLPFQRRIFKARRTWPTRHWHTEPRSLHCLGHALPNQLSRRYRRSRAHRPI